ncbi:MAG: metal ABC transporter ATP-binding protein [Hyphomicrobiaceae bacterium]|nr:metal ABC transporter ATP-binding protein [Hyphomicrobiaceae bacterium]
MIPPFDLSFAASAPVDGRDEAAPVTGLPTARTSGQSHHGRDHRHPHDDDDEEHEHDHGPPQPHCADALLSARQLSFNRGRRRILQSVDLDIRAGEILTLIGPNGAGKTTLVKLLLGIERPSNGSIQRHGGLVIGYVPQRFDLDRAMPMTVQRFLTLSGHSLDLAGAEKLLSEVGAAGLAERQFAELSGGELQRVLIARALVRSPHLVVLDEPVRGVDYVGEAELYALISRLRTERQIGVLLVSHDLHVVMAQSDRVLCLNGHVCCSGVPETVAQHPEYARLFGPKTARLLGLYTHAHDHGHDLSGAPVPRREGGDAAI